MPINYLQNALKLRDKKLKNEMSQIAIIGYGVVGQAVGKVLAAKVKNAKVIVFDSKQRQQGVGRVRMVESINEALGRADYVFLCVPSHLEEKGIDGKGWKRLAGQIDKHAKANAVVVIKTTLVPGDAAKLEKLTGRRAVVCPEFMAEGTAERDILKPHRVLVGGSDKAAVDSVIRLYRHWVPATRIIRMDAWSAQLAKLLANAMLAQRVASINSAATLCSQVGADVKGISEAVGLDPRIGPLYLKSSAGFGGSCLEKDLRLLCGVATYNQEPEIADYWRSVIEQNDARVDRVTQTISNLAGKGGKVAILGMAYRQGASTSRNAVSLRIAAKLRRMGHLVVGHDPIIKKARGVEMARSIEEAITNASCITVLNDEREYKKLRWLPLQSVVKPKAVVYYVASGISSPVRRLR
jgi:UDPglucose 6-dehydrogenase